MYSPQAFINLAALCLIVLAYAVTAEETVKVCFYSNTAGERGTEVAMYEYADHLEKYYKMKSHIIFPKLIETSNRLSDLLLPELQPVGIGGPGCRLSLPRFQERFNVSFCGEEFSEEVYKRILSDTFLDPESIKPYSICNRLSWEAKHVVGCDLLYIIKGGLKKHSPVYPDAFGELPTMVHSVFNWEIHGSVYAAISPAIKAYRPRDSGNIVPHMVMPPDFNLINKVSSHRAHLKIPHDALTVCRHGGDDSFNLVAAKKAVLSLLDAFDHRKLHFVFLGTPSYRKHFQTLAENTTRPEFYLAAAQRQIHFLQSSTSMQAKEAYFKTCDCMLHARDVGETFGLAVAEFSMRNKPVITQGPRRHYADFHLRVLGDKAFTYHTQQDVVNIISKMVTEGIRTDVDYNGYREYEPEKVMAIFKKLFIDPAVPLIGKNVSMLPTLW